MEARLLSPKGCADAGRVYLWADTEERTLATGRALLAGMLPGCDVKVSPLTEGSNDPLFHPISSGAGIADPGACGRIQAARDDGTAHGVLRLGPAQPVHCARTGFQPIESPPANDGAGGSGESSTGSGRQARRLEYHARQGIMTLSGIRFEPSGRCCSTP